MRETKRLEKRRQTQKKVQKIEKGRYSKEKNAKRGGGKKRPRKKKMIERIKDEKEIVDTKIHKRQGEV